VRAPVTSGAGFIGSHPVVRLLEVGDEVQVLDNFATGRRSNPEVVRSNWSRARCSELRTHQQSRRRLRTVFHDPALLSVAESTDQQRDQRGRSGSRRAKRMTLNRLLADLRELLGCEIEPEYAQRVQETSRIHSPSSLPHAPSSAMDPRCPFATACGAKSSTAARRNPAPTGAHLERRAPSGSSKVSFLKRG